ncbi:MAG: sugar transferase [Candidatus Komeilibacteria bacterium]|nr:sugar transferase [Candidatus Komeilibacteria bacterium]
MKKLELTFAALLVPLDYLALLAAGTAAYFLRFQSFLTDLRPVVFTMPYADFFKVIAAVAAVWLLVFALNGLYSIKRQGFWNYFSKIFVASSAATLVIVVAFFFNFQLFSSRLIILTGWALAIIFVTLERLIIHYIKKIFYKKGLGVRRVVIIGSGKSAADIMAEFKAKPSFGFLVVKVLPNFTEISEEELTEELSSRGIDDVILADPEITVADKNRLVNFCLANHLNYKYAASLLETKLINFSLSTIAGLPFIEVKQTRLDGWGRIIKRVFDLFLSLLFIIVLSPILIIVGLIVVLTSAGPMVVKLVRIGNQGQIFNLYKFRSMVKNAHLLKPSLSQYNQRADGPLFKMANDPRLTHFGKFIRRWSLDELPQLFNVLSGRMSLVGPRPHEPEEVARFQTREKKLLAIKPGITGMAQVSGRSDLLWQDEVKLDTYYVENWSLDLDIQILLKTPKAVIGRRQTV